MDFKRIKNTKNYKNTVKQLKELINCYESVKRLNTKRLRCDITTDCLTITYIGNCHIYTSKCYNV